MRPIQGKARKSLLNVFGFYHQICKKRKILGRTACKLFRKENRSVEENPSRLTCNMRSMQKNIFTSLMCLQAVISVKGGVTKYYLCSTYIDVFIFWFFLIYNSKIKYTFIFAENIVFYDPHPSEAVYNCKKKNTIYLCFWRGTQPVLHTFICWSISRSGVLKFKHK